MNQDMFNILIVVLFIIYAWHIWNLYSITDLQTKTLNVIASLARDLIAKCKLAKSESKEQSDKQGEE